MVGFLFSKIIPSIELGLFSYYFILILNVLKSYILVSVFFMGKRVPGRSSFISDHC